MFFLGVPFSPLSTLCLPLQDGFLFGLFLSYRYVWQRYCDVPTPGDPRCGCQPLLTPRLNPSPPLPMYITLFRHLKFFGVSRRLSPGGCAFVNFTLGRLWEEFD